MSLAQQVAHFLLRRRHVLAVAGADGDRRHAAALDLLPAEHALARRRDRNQHQVVLILADHALSLALEHADDRMRNAANAHGFAHRVRFAEQRTGDRLSEQHDLGPRVDLRLVETLAAGHFPLARLEELGGGALDLRGPVAVAVDHLSAAAQRRRGGLHGGNLPLQRIRVVFSDRWLRPGSLARAAQREVAREDDDEIRSEALDLVLDARLRTGTHGDHRDHRADADDDAEHRERRPELVHAQRGQRDTQRGEEIHAGAPAISASRAASAA